MEKHRILYLASGLLFLAVSVAGGAWWEFIAGEVSKPALYVGLSPFGFEAKLLGSQLITPSPLMAAIFTAERLLAILGSATIIAGSLIRKPWARRLFNLRPLTVPLGFAALILAGAAAAAAFVATSTPLAEVLPNLGEALAPYSGRSLAVNLRPLLRVEGTLEVSTTSRFTLWFWLALLSGALCLAGAVERRREARRAAP